ncbi:MAG: 7-carboxy-7-deazaguanine synthase [Syntrophorhabdus sp. PtaU1.Bin058]|nr:MAG: 7-carboxy-7-deazaguanine synthase [Syntrophorhabdus sp. PtaU1.Bin058]
MAYRVKEIYYTLQGEGLHTGRPAIFCRFSGCNLACRFCDTDFDGTDGPGGGVFESPETLAINAAKMFPGPGTHPFLAFVVCTGGEPALQIDEALVAAFHNHGLEVGIETNGTLPLPGGIDWVCVSPKAGAELVIRSGDELKLVFPQEGAGPERYEHLNFKYFFLQPMDGPDLKANTQKAAEYCLSHPRWRLSVQTHKLLGIR